MNMARFVKCIYIDYISQTSFIVCSNRCALLLFSPLSVVGKVPVSAIFPCISLRHLNIFISACFNLFAQLTQLIFTSNSAKETLEKGVKYFQS